MKRLQTWRVKNQQRAPAQTKCCKLNQSFPKMPEQRFDSAYLKKWEGLLECKALHY